MAPQLRVLLIEDEQGNIDLWNDAAAGHNADANAQGFLIETDVARSVAEAESLLSSRRFDAAVVDLRLQSDAEPVGPNDDGNLLVKKILVTRPIAVVVYTGQKAEVADFECVQVKVIDRGDGLQPVISWLKEQANLLFQLRSVLETFDAETAKVFFKAIWPRWQHWTNSIADVPLLARLVARHVIAHAHDSMLQEGGEQVHPEETYFVPPLKARLDTGDILDFENSTWIVVTPRCDLAHDDKVQSVLLAKCVDISTDWDREIASGSNGAKKRLARLVQHDGEPKQHFLPRLSDQNGAKRGPWLVQFHDLRAMDARTARAELPALRFASLSPLFIPSLTERFGAYFSRVGTPSLSSD